MFSNKKYIKSINANGIFDNTYETKMPQTVISKAILCHFEKSQKKPKCLFIGWDGCRADAMKYLIKSDNEKISGANDTAVYSAISALKQNGGLYVTYVGGEKNAPQETSTAQGWASALCGKWMKEPWRIGIKWSLDDDFPTVLKTLSVKGYQTSFSAIWPIHFDNTYKNEIDFADKNNLNRYYCKFETDSQLYDNLKERIQSDDDFILGIFENPDMNGHGTGFGDSNYRYVAGVCNLDRLSYQLLTEIKKRNTFDDEDWLVVIASDHGGHSTRHGTQNIQDRTTFLALSKSVEDLTE
ncbi:alkaline phosphatase family protein [uncultured Eubacterium sp.]|uniref:alkaline phosphatase family protein n=1 Tax=uncultured Eubacterium sp. TaxID=165185 RepID=UPI0015BAD1BE|nr:alkaline phosphatase family protein [uncultured Eubacterium sp.]